jgi:hypothetical protein
MGKTKKITKKKYELNSNGDPQRKLDYDLARKYAEETDLPLIEELALKLNCDEDTVGNRAKADPEFGTIVKLIRLKQKVGYMKMLPSKEYSTRGIIFNLNVNHKMIETQRSEIANPDGKTFSVTSDNFNKLDDKQLTDLLRGASQESNQG